MTSHDWINHFNHNPITPLIESDNYAIKYFVRKDLFEEPVEDISSVWELKEVQKIVKRQTPKGCWKSNSANKKRHPVQNYELLETYRPTNILVTMYGMNRNHPRIAEALEWFVDKQLTSGLWNHSYSKIHKYVENDKTRELQLWISLAILRIFKNFPIRSISMD